MCGWWHVQVADRVPDNELAPAVNLLFKVAGTQSTLCSQVMRVVRRRLSRGITGHVLGDLQRALLANQDFALVFLHNVEEDCRAVPSASADGVWAQAYLDMIFIDVMYFYTTMITHV
jgi:hypothetical protein